MKRRILRLLGASAAAGLFTLSLAACSAERETPAADEEPSEDVDELPPPGEMTEGPADVMAAFEQLEEDTYLVEVAQNDWREGSFEVDGPEGGISGSMFTYPGNMDGEYGDEYELVDDAETEVVALGGDIWVRFAGMKDFGIDPDQWLYADEEEVAEMYETPAAFLGGLGVINPWDVITALGPTLEQLEETEDRVFTGPAVYESRESEVAITLDSEGRVSTVTIDYEADGLAITTTLDFSDYGAEVDIGEPEGEIVSFADEHGYGE